MKRVIAGILLFAFLFTGLTATSAFAKNEANDLNAFDYVLFSGSSAAGLSINSSTTNIVGNVHTNNDFLFQGSELKISGTCESVGIIDIKSSSARISGTKENTKSVQMPYLNVRNKVLNNASVYNDSKHYHGDTADIDKPVIVNGNVSLNCSLSNVNDCIVASNDIVFNTAKVLGNKNKDIIICSENGNITINCSYAEINGILYAPKGTVTINCADLQLKGKIIADKIVIRGSRQNIVSGADCIPDDIEPITVKENDIVFSTIRKEYECFLKHKIYFTVVDKERKPVSDVKCKIKVTGNAAATKSLVTDSNGRGTIVVSDDTAEKVTLTVTTQNGISRSVDLLFTKDDTVGKVAPVKIDDIVVDKETGFEVVKNQILVVFKENTTQETVRQIVHSVGGEIVGYINGMNDYQIKISGNHSLDYIKRLIKQLNNNKDVEIAVLNQIIPFTGRTPDKGKDPEWDNDDWDESNPGGNNWGLEAIYAPSAWNYNDKMNPIRIGILDTALKYDHEDLKIPSENYKYSATGASDKNADKVHGTHVAGIVGAISNNDKGITGIVWNRELYAFAPELLDTNQNDDRYKSQLFEFKYGLMWLLNRGCKVINMSMGVDIVSSEDLSKILSDEVTADILDKYIETPKKYWTPFMKRLINKGYDFVVVQAAGNSNIDAKFNGFMCSIDDREVRERIIIAGNITNKPGKEKHEGYDKHFTSNYGDIVDVLAPGTRILSTSVEYDKKKGRLVDTYAIYSGTSLSAPHVSGVAAMVWAVNPELTGAQVKNIVVGTADRPVTYKNDDNESVLFGNIVNAKAAVERALSEHAKERIPSKKYGILAGRVTDAVEGTGIENATVFAYRNKGDTRYYATASTYEDGSYELYLEPGDYYILVEKEGYLAVYAYTNIQEGLTTYNAELKVVSEKYSGKGTVTGIITNALDGSGVEGLTIKFRKGINNTKGEVIKEIVTESGGKYSAQLEAGSYTGEISGKGFITSYFYVVSVGGRVNREQNGVISPIIPENQIRIVLTWGEYPGDLDSHLTGPAADGRFHIYYASKTYYQDGEKYAELDRDDTNSYGPETITIYKQTNGIYRYSVHDFTNRNRTDSNSLSLSGAEVRVYRGNNLLAVFTVPGDKTGTVWTVFELDGDKIIPVNSLYNESDMNTLRNTRYNDLQLFTNLPEKE